MGNLKFILKHYGLGVGYAQISVLCLITAWTFIALFTMLISEFEIRSAIFGFSIGMGLILLNILFLVWLEMVDKAIFKKPKNANSIHSSKPKKIQNSTQEMRLGVINTKPSSRKCSCFSLCSYNEISKDSQKAHAQLHQHVWRVLKVVVGLSFLESFLFQSLNVLSWLCLFGIVVVRCFQVWSLYKILSFFSYHEDFRVHLWSQKLLSTKKNLLLRRLNHLSKAISKSKTTVLNAASQRFTTPTHAAPNVPDKYTSSLFSLEQEAALTREQLRRHQIHVESQILLYQAISSSKIRSSIRCSCLSWSIVFILTFGWLFWPGNTSLLRLDTAIEEAFVSINSSVDEMKYYESLNTPSKCLSLLSGYTKAQKDAGISPCPGVSCALEDTSVETWSGRNCSTWQGAGRIVWWWTTDTREHLSRQKLLETGFGHCWPIPLQHDKFSIPSWRLLFHNRQGIAPWIASRSPILSDEWRIGPELSNFATCESTFYETEKDIQTTGSYYGWDVENKQLLLGSIFDSLWFSAQQEWNKLSTHDVGSTNVSSLVGFPLESTNIYYPKSLQTMLDSRENETHKAGAVDYIFMPLLSKRTLDLGFGNDPIILEPNSTKYSFGVPNDIAYMCNTVSSNAIPANCNTNPSQCDTTSANNIEMFADSVPMIQRKQNRGLRTSGIPGCFLIHVWNFMRNGGCSAGLIQDIGAATCLMSLRKESFETFRLLDQELVNNGLLSTNTSTSSVKGVITREALDAWWRSLHFLISIFEERAKKEKTFFARDKIKFSIYTNFTSSTSASTPISSQQQQQQQEQQEQTGATLENLITAIYSWRIMDSWLKFMFWLQNLLVVGFTGFTMLWPLLVNLEIKGYSNWRLGRLSWTSPSYLIASTVQTTTSREAKKLIYNEFPLLPSFKLQPDPKYVGQAIHHHHHHHKYGTSKYDRTADEFSWNFDQKTMEAVDESIIASSYKMDKRHPRKRKNIYKIKKLMKEIDDDEAEELIQSSEEDSDYSQNEEEEEDSNYSQNEGGGGGGGGEDQIKHTRKKGNFLNSISQLATWAEGFSLSNPDSEYTKTANKTLPILFLDAEMQVMLKIKYVRPLLLFIFINGSAWLHALLTTSSHLIGSILLSWLIWLITARRITISWFSFSIYVAESQVVIGNLVAWFFLTLGISCGIMILSWLCKGPFHTRRFFWKYAWEPYLCQYLLGVFQQLTPNVGLREYSTARAVKQPQSTNINSTEADIEARKRFAECFVKIVSQKAFCEDLKSFHTLYESVMVTHEWAWFNVFLTFSWIVQCIAFSPYPWSYGMWSLPAAWNFSLFFPTTIFAALLPIAIRSSYTIYKPLHSVLETKNPFKLKVQNEEKEKEHDTSILDEEKSCWERCCSRHTITTTTTATDDDDEGDDTDDCGGGNGGDADDNDHDDECPNDQLQHQHRTHNQKKNDENKLNHNDTCYTVKDTALNHTGLGLIDTDDDDTTTSNTKSNEETDISECEDDDKKSRNSEKQENEVSFKTEEETCLPIQRKHTKQDKHKAGYSDFKDNFNNETRSKGGRDETINIKIQKGLENEEYVGLDTDTFPDEETLRQLLLPSKLHPCNTNIPEKDSLFFLRRLHIIHPSLRGLMSDYIIGKTIFLLWKDHAGGSADIPWKNIHLPKSRKRHQEKHHRNRNKNNRTIFEKDMAAQLLWKTITR